MDFDYVVMPAVISIIAVLLVWWCTRRMQTLCSSARPWWRKAAGCIVLSLLLLLAVIAGASSSFNAVKLSYVRATVLQREDVCHTEHGPVLRELEDRGRSDQETATTGPYGSLPILIFSHDPAQRQWANQLGNGWDQTQEDLKKLSTRSLRIIAKGSGHYVQFDRPDLIETEVPAFIEQIRGTASPFSAYGSTTEE